MAISDAYATVSELKAFKPRFSSDDDAALGSGLKAIARYLDRKLNWPSGFNKDGTATTRVYPGSGGRVLMLTHSVASLAGIQVKVNDSYDGDFAGETALAAGVYGLRGEGGVLDPDKGPEPRPWTQLYLPGWSTKGEWTKDYRVQVTAIHGWPAVPEAIHFANMELLLIIRGESTFSTDRIQEMDSVVSTSPQARAILKGLSEVYNRYPVAVA